MTQDANVDGWKRISPAEAAQHSLYGIKGWLIVFALASLLGLGGTQVTLNSASEYLPPDHPAIRLLKFLFTLDVVATVAIYWLLFTKHSKFRLITTGIILGTYPVAFLVGSLGPFEGFNFGNVMARSLIPWLISCGIWVTYLNKSERVRVTFEHMIRAKASPASVVSNSMSSNPMNMPSPTHTTTNVVPKHPDQQTQFAPATYVTEEDLWAQALEEFEGGSRRSGLWARVFAEANGDENVAKAGYLRLRVDELQQEQKIIAEEIASKNRAMDEAKHAELDLDRRIAEVSKNWWLSKQEKSELIKQLEAQKNV